MSDDLITRERELRQSVAPQVSGNLPFACAIAKLYSKKWNWSVIQKNLCISDAFYHTVVSLKF